MLTLTVPDAATRSRNLFQQHREWSRGGYDGHNRHSGLTPMSRLRGRRMRRRMRRSLAWLARAWDPAPRRFVADGDYTAFVAA